MVKTYSIFVSHSWDHSNDLVSLHSLLSSRGYFYYDPQIIATLGSTLNKILKSCGLQDTAVFHINNKKLVKAFLAEVSEDEEQMQQISNLIDKYKKIGKEKWKIKS